MNVNIGIPWLIETLEKRFGVLGKRMADVLVLFITLLVFAIPSVGLAIAIKKWLWPESVSLLDRQTWEALAIILIVSIIIGATVVGIHYVRVRVGRRLAED